MRNLIKVFFGTIRLFLLFAGCTILFYYGIMWINQEYENYRRYDEPEGSAVKAFQPIESGENGWFERLMLFYRNGE
ncbi:YqzK family protein [Lederbergia citrea]|uniref:YqzK family protein n=1 Tax=Lederbergia citrea TaxID=2833581 RepID=A0A942UQT1_9BACI|nr:YqzK family protein [Lederbergia citrea]MBS4176448.1 YqzK family protein [Lederbergia citrea]MBS4203009.1 YqzK family protein [Lederbergia citrea]MBS4222319.1 YqzK family protein [Lederbergia citrea]